MFRNARSSLAVVIDSDVEFRSMVGDVLVADFGFENVIEAADFESAAVRIQSASRIDLGVFDVAHAFTDDRPAEVFPMSMKNLACWVGVLGAEDDAIIRRCLNRGAKGLIGRDLKRYELRRAFDLILGGWRYLPPGTELRIGNHAPTFIEAEVRFEKLYGT